MADGLKLPTDEEISAALEQVFARAKEHAPSRFLESLIPVEVSDGLALINYVPDYEMNEICEFANMFRALMSGTKLADEQSRLKVAVYCHIMESDLPLTVVWNLLRLQHNETCQWTFTKQTRKGERTCEYTEEKVQEIVRKADALQLDVGRILEMIWERDLRNSFSHSQYVLIGGNYMATRRSSPLSRRQNRTLSDGDCYYSYETLDALYQRACQWLFAFIETYKSYIAPYKDGRVHDVWGRPIFWDCGRRRWLWFSENIQGD